MPIYEYKCERCGATNELIVLGKEEAPSCKACGSSDLTKLMSAHNIAGSTNSYAGEAGGSCCGSPNSCGNPGSCCGG